MNTANTLPNRLTGRTAVRNHPRLCQAPRVPGRSATGSVLHLLMLLALLAGCAGSKIPDPSTSALHFFQRGNAAYLDQDYPGAVRWYQRAQDANPMSPDIAYNLGLAYFQTGAMELAVKAFQQALRLDPNFADAHMNLALAFDRLYDRATAHYHFNQYQSLAMSQAPAPGSAQTSAAQTSAASSATSSAAPVTSPPPVAARRTPKPQGASAPGGPLTAEPDSEKAKTKRQGQTAPAQAQQRTGNTYRSTVTPQAQAQEPATPQGTDKWWIQDQKPSPW